MKKNVLLLINQLYGGGAQKVIANLSIYLSEHYNITFVIYNDTHKVVFPIEGELIKINLPYAADTHNNSFYRRIVRFFSLVKQLRQLKKEKDIDVAISFMEASNIINVLSKRKEKIILSVRSYLSHEFEDHPRLQVFRPFVKLLYNRADHVVVPSLLLKHDLITNFGVKDKKVSLIYNFTDNKLVEQLKHSAIPHHILEVLNNFDVVINVGRITNPKAQWLLMPVMAKLKKKVANAKLIILGEGPRELNILEAAAANNLKVYREGVDDKNNILDYDIYLMGFTKNPFPFLAKSRVFIKSSVYEGFPNVIIEGMTCALPVISSDCASGPREILQPSSDFLKSTQQVEYGEFGILTPVAGKEIPEQLYADATAEVLADLLSDEEKRKHYSQKSIERASHFEKSRILKEWIDIIEKNKSNG